MQVSEEAALDVGGRDRFDLAKNRAIGREYLAWLYRRYKNWPDAIAAYNWGMGKVDRWVKAGRPAKKLLTGVVAYMTRVLHDSGLCDGTETKQLRTSLEIANRRDAHDTALNPSAYIICGPLWRPLFQESGRGHADRPATCSGLFTLPTRSGSCLCPVILNTAIRSFGCTKNRRSPFSADKE
jgi:hypothetical protein